MKSFLGLISLITILGISGCSSFRPGWLRSDSFEVEHREDNSTVEGIDGPTGGHFDEEGNWIPDNPDIEWTYTIPDISSGFIFDIGTYTLSPSLQVELFEFDTGVPYLGTWKIDAGVAYQRAYGYIGKLWTSIFEISTGFFVGWNWEDGELSWGIGATIIKF